MRGRRSRHEYAFIGGWRHVAAWNLYHYGEWAKPQLHCPKYWQLAFGSKTSPYLGESKEKLSERKQDIWLEALDKDFNFVALKGKSYNLFHALDDGEFAEAVKKIEDGECQDAHIEVDFDTGSLGFLSDNHGEAAQLTLPITAIVDAYSGSLRKKNSSQSYVNTNNFAKQIEKTCDAQLELSPHEEANGEAPQVQKISL